MIADDAAVALRRFPQLARPAPPTSVRPYTGGRREFRIADEFDRLLADVAAGTYRLRCPARSPEGLVGPFRGHGYCLEGILDGDVLCWYDPRIPATDRDLVLIRWDDADLAALIQRNRHDPTWRRTYPRVSNLATKWLRHVGNYAFLAYRHPPAAGMVPLNRNRILGVLAYVELDGRPIYGSGDN